MDINQLIQGVPTQQRKAVCSAYISNAYDRHRDFLSDLKVPDLKAQAMEWLSQHVQLAQDLVSHGLINQGISFHKAEKLARMDINSNAIKNNYRLSKDGTKKFDKQYHMYTK